MLQSLNQFLVLATLLSVGIGGLAVPVRRHPNTVVLVNTDFSNGIIGCLDAVDNADGTVPGFFDCNGNPDQEWVTYYGTSTTIRNKQSGLCLSTNSENQKIQLEDCGDNSDPNQEWDINDETGQISNVDGDLCMESNANNFDKVAICQPDDTTQRIIAMDPSLVLN